MTTLKPATREMLKTVSVASIATTLMRRGLRDQFMQGLERINPACGTMVGEAFTLRTIPAREDLNPIEVYNDPSHPQRKAIDECPEGAVFVVDSRKDARAASAGGILVMRLMIRGVAGIVTDGGFRDTPDIAKLAIPAYHNRPAAMPSRRLHQVIDANIPIACGDVAVFPGDIVVGDAEGVVVVPAHLVEECAEEAVEMTIYEAFVVEEVAKGRPVRGLYPLTDQELKLAYADWRKNRNR